MKQLTDEVFAQVRGALERADIYLEEGSQSHPINRLAIAALDTAQPEPVNQVLLKALSALLTHSGMDEDEWSKPTFDQARAAIKLATTKTQECGMCGYVGTKTDAVGQCPRCHWDELQAQPERAPLICTWTQEDDFDMPGVYHTSCGEMWSFTEGGIKENNTKFCPHCGGGIKRGGQHD